MPDSVERSRRPYWLGSLPGDIPSQSNLVSPLTDCLLFVETPTRLHHRVSSTASATAPPWALMLPISHPSTILVLLHNSPRFSSSEPRTIAMTPCPTTLMEVSTPTTASTTVSSGRVYLAIFGPRKTISCGPGFGGMDTVSRRRARATGFGSAANAIRGSPVGPPNTLAPASTILRSTYLTSTGFQKTGL